LPFRATMALKTISFLAVVYRSSLSCPGKHIYSNDLLCRSDCRRFSRPSIFFLVFEKSYSVWIKRNKAQLAQVRATLNERAQELEEHPEFDAVHENDLAAIDRFRESLGLKPLEKSSVVSPANSHEDDQSDDSQSRRSPLVTPRDTHKRKMVRSSLSSQRSRLSAQSNSLSPIGEGAPSSGESVSDRDSVSEKDVDESPRPKRRLKTSGSNNRGSDSLGSRSTRSKMDVSQSMMEEVEEESIGSTGSD
jgi:hypothetical protein